MRSIERRFNNIKEKNPNLGDCIIFTKAVRGQNFTKDMISRWFNKLVDRGEYEQSDKKELIRGFVEATQEIQTPVENNVF